MLELIIDIGQTNKKIPEGEISFNGQIVHSGAYNQTQYVMKPKIGKNILKVSLNNKTGKDTQTKGNQITEDVFIIVKKIRCLVTRDEITNLDDVGIYNTERGEILKTYGFLSYNGHYTFEFDYPFFVFYKK